MPLHPMRPGRRRRPDRARPDRDRSPLDINALIILAALVLAWLTFWAAQTALASPAAQRVRVAATSGLAAPRQLSPANRAHVSTLPGFSWRAVTRAAKYEFQLAADSAFKSMVSKGSFQTVNTYASIDTALADGDYYWRVRAIDTRDRAGRWSPARSLAKRWTDAPQLRGPVNGAIVTYPGTPLVLRWDPVPFAYKYRVQIATDPSFAHSALGDRSAGVETSGTAFSVQSTLAPGRYYWSVTPLDAEKHPGTRSAVGSFTWDWPTRLEPTQLSTDDLDPNAEVFDPQLKWAPIAGAAQYQVEISTAQVKIGTARDFPAGSVVCCSDPTTGTSLSPTKVLANNTGSGVAGDPEQFGYWWRVRAVDLDGNAGEWNYGQPFDKTYPAPVGGLHLRDNLGDAPTDRDTATGVVDTWSPAIVWHQVPGASSYEVQVVPYVQVPSTSISVCNWSSTSSDTWDVVTATTAWTPLGNPSSHKPSGVLTDLSASRDFSQPVPNREYCVRVRARRDRDAKGKEVVSDWTVMAEGSAPAFRYVAPPTPSGATLALSDSDYLQPTTGQVHSWMPLFTWQPVDGARGYFVVVARDQQFTKIVDLAFTNVPAYAPRRNNTPWTYPDETTSYWWAVVPTALPDGDIAPTPPTGNAPRRFLKSSTPPQQPMAPGGGQSIAQQPTFRWQPTLGARSYTLQVAQDESFGEPLMTATTTSTAYTAVAALPADTALYWRVRANDEMGIGLNWSSTERFRRTLPVPALSPDDPLGGEAIPVLSWSPVDGAVSYDMHVEQADGTKRDFTMRSTAFTPVIFYGTGVWRWQVRANFKSGSRTVSGGYSDLLPFTRRIATPTGLRTTKNGDRALLSWSSALMAKQYKVQVSTTDSFSTVIEQTTTDHTSWAPKMTSPAFRSGEPLYWRVAVVDEGNNVGGFAMTALRAPKPLKVRASGKLRRGHTATVMLTLTSGRERVSGVRVGAQGPVSKVKARSSGKRGTVRLRVKATKKGVVRFTATKRGYATATTTLRVR
jgi:hypothetical protein